MQKLIKGCVRNLKSGAPGIRNRSVTQSATKCICYIVRQDSIGPKVTVCSCVFNFLSILDLKPQTLQ